MRTLMISSLCLLMLGCATPDSDSAKTASGAAAQSTAESAPCRTTVRTGSNLPRRKCGAPSEREQKRDALDGVREGTMSPSGASSN